MLEYDDAEPTATPEEIVDELKRWHKTYSTIVPNRLEVEKLDRVIELARDSEEASVFVWARRLDDWADEYSSQGVFNTARKVENWE